MKLKPKKRKRPKLFEPAWVTQARIDRERWRRDDKNRNRQQIRRIRRGVRAQ